MICFQNLYLWYSDTTLKLTVNLKSWLWFAFKIYIFDILIQLSWFIFEGQLCCDLLSKFISLIFWYNQENNIICDSEVVICFQNLYLWYSDTTQPPKCIGLKKLWLLSKFISLIFWYNKIHRQTLRRNVVICFQNYIFDILIQRRLSQDIYALVVICFKIYIFDILIQLMQDEETWEPCDLLSKFISLIFWYNWNSAALF